MKHYIVFPNDLIMPADMVTATSPKEAVEEFIKMRKVHIVDKTIIFHVGEVEATIPVSSVVYIGVPDES